MGNCASNSPAATRSDCLRIAFAFALDRCPRSAFACAAADLIRPSARMNWRGMVNPEIGKLSTARCVCAPHSAAAGTFNSPMLSRSMRKSAIKNSVQPSQDEAGDYNLPVYHSRFPAREPAMQPTPLTALSPLDGRYAAKVEALRPIFSEFGLMQRRVRVEIQWLLALAGEQAIAELGALNAGARQFLLTLADGFSLQDAERIKAIEATTNHDVKAVEYFIKERIGRPRRSGQGEGIRPLRLHQRGHQQPRLCAHAARCARSRAHADVGQAHPHAAPDGACAGRTSHAVAHARADRQPYDARQGNRQRRLRAWIASASRSPPWNSPARSTARSAITTPTSSPVPKWTGRCWPGASSNHSDSRGIRTRRRSSRTTASPNCATRSAAAISSWSTSRRDVWGYISLGYFKQALKPGEVGSCTMPHKVNPIDFENAEGNFGVANSLLCTLCGKTADQPLATRPDRLHRAARGWHRVRPHPDCAGIIVARPAKLNANPERLAADLDANWEVLAEAVQTVMRRYGLPEPYEQLKALTRGQGITRESHARVHRRLGVAGGCQSTFARR